MKKTIWILLAIFCAIVTLIVGCQNNPFQSPKKLMESIDNLKTTNPIDLPKANESLKEKKVTKKEFGKKWPFTVDEGTLQCIKYPIPKDNPYADELVGVTFSHDGKVYGLNGVAQSWGRRLGYSDVNEIWSIDSVTYKVLRKEGVPHAYAILKSDLGPMIEEGLKLKGN